MPPPKSKPFNNSAWQTHEQQFLARRLRQKGIRTDEIPDTLSQADATELLLHKSTDANSPMNVYSRSRLDSASLSDANKHSGGNRTYEFPQKQQSSLSTQELARIRNHASESVVSPSLRTPTKAFPTIRSNNTSPTLGTPKSNITSDRHQYQYQYTSGVTDDNRNSASPYRSHYESSSSVHPRSSSSNQIKETSDQIDETLSVDRGSTAHTVQSQRSQYLQALEQQIQEKEARKRAEKEKEANWERKLEREAMEYDYFGRRRGGGGEPVRDESGQPITLLKTLNRDLVTFSPSSAQSHETHSTHHNRRHSAFGMNNNESTSLWNKSNLNDRTSHTSKDQSKYPNQSIHHSPSNNQNQSIHGLQSISNLQKEYENRSIHSIDERKQGEYTGGRSSNASQLSHGGTGSIAGLDPTLRTGRRMYTQNANTSSFSLFGNSPVNNNKSIFSSNDNRTPSTSTRPSRRQPANEHLDSKQEHDIHELDSVGPPAAYSSDRNVSGTNQQDLEQYAPNLTRNSLTKNYTSPYSVSNALNTESENSVTRNYKDTNAAYNTPETTELTLKQETRINELESRLEELEMRLENETKVSEELKKENYELNSETTGLRDKLSAAIDILERYRERYGPLE